MHYQPLPIDKPADEMEQELLERWARENLFARTQTASEGKAQFVFFEGPPTANGKPGIHHVFSRTIKDLFCRHRAMKGFHVARRAGWDTHGLPVEIEVEKQLGINDKQQIEPMLNGIDTLPDELGNVDTLLADTGYFSAANVAACEAAGIDPLIAMGRQPHHPPLSERFADVPPPPENPTPVEAMAHRLNTAQGRDLYALRKQTPEFRSSLRLALARSRASQMCPYRH